MCMYVPTICQCNCNSHTILAIGIEGGISYNGKHLPNHHLLLLNNFPLESDLLCTTIGPCCSLNPHLTDDTRHGISPSGIGSWRYPNGSYVLPTLADDSYGITRKPGEVNLHRLGLHTADGVWRCEVPGKDGEKDIRHIGIYAQGHGMYMHQNVFTAVNSSSCYLYCWPK
jgi:hypothetical protein